MESIKSTVKKRFYLSMLFLCPFYFYRCRQIFYLNNLVLNLRKSSHQAGVILRGLILFAAHILASVYLRVCHPAASIGVGKTSSTAFTTTSTSTTTNVACRRAALSVSHFAIVYNLNAFLFFSAL
uniref:Uncharacterized protein n=1 Tax=Palpitomonas bilix TaxID=652834 RepID=A0A7S3D1D4_9EUKA